MAERGGFEEVCKSGQILSCQHPLNRLQIATYRNNSSKELSLIIRDNALKYRFIQLTNLIENVEYFRNKLAVALSLMYRCITMVHITMSGENYFEIIHNCRINLAYDLSII